MLRNKNIVYSTNKNLKLDEDSSLKINPIQISTLNVKIIKKKANKITTVIENFDFNKEEILILAKELKKICSSGGTDKENKIIIWPISIKENSHIMGQDLGFYFNEKFKI